MCPSPRDARRLVNSPRGLHKNPLLLIPRRTHPSTFGFYVSPNSNPRTSACIMSAPRACDACKLRKVKCDMADPCANCRMSQLCCAYNILPRKRGRRVGARTLNTTAPPRAITANPEILSWSSVSPSSPRVIPANTESSWSSASPPTPHSQGFVPITNVLDLIKKPAVDICAPATQIRADLMTAVREASPLDTVEGVIHRCLDLYVQYLFVIIPILHEPTLRDGVSLFRSDGDAHAWTLSQSPAFDAASALWQMKTFTLVTALCACITAALPESFLAQRHSTSTAFLVASRSMHQLYKDYDLEHPDSSSLSIRMWHSRALQSITGSNWTSSHCLMEASLIAHQLRLYDENSVNQSSGIESQLLRACFLALYASENAAYVFGDRPYVLNQMLFPGNLTVHDHGEHDEPLLDTTKNINQGSLESRLLEGFQLQRRVWSLAADFIRDIRAHVRLKSWDRLNPETKTSELAHLTESYLAFMGLVDDFPPWLQLLNHEDNTGDADVAKYQRTCFWVQRCNFMTAFHCLRLVILQQCIDDNLVTIVGLDIHGLSVPIKKVEIVHDFLQELQMIPFICFKVLGESVVSDKSRFCQRCWFAS